MRHALCSQEYMNHKNQLKIDSMKSFKCNYGSISIPSPCYEQMYKDKIPLPLCVAGCKNKMR